MPVLEVHIILLTYVAAAGPVNGYQIRQELMTWTVAGWPALQPGSIYSGLATLTKAGFVQRHDIPEGSRTTAVYTVTPAGQKRLRDVVIAAICTPHQHGDKTFQAALIAAPLFPRSMFLENLRHRQAALQVQIEHHRTDLEKRRPDMPPLPARMIELRLDQSAAELEWLAATIQAIESGDYAFADDPNPWRPPPDADTAARAADRQRYLALIEQGL